MVTTQSDGQDSDYDVVVIGAGPAGENAADRIVKGGLSVAIVESELVGGECSYWACMPSKVLLRTGEVLEEALHVDGAREAVTGRVDVAAVFARRDVITADWLDEAQAAWARDDGITLIRGHARLTNSREVTVLAAGSAEQVLRARHAVVIATGSASLMPDIPGLLQARPWSSREATSSHKVPKRLAIIGGGVVGVEMATAYASLGSMVTVLSLSEILANQEPFAGAAVSQALRAAGVEVRTGVTVASVNRDTFGTAHITMQDGSVIDCDEVLVATGRIPRTDGLGLDTVGLPTSGWLPTDDTLRVLGADGTVLDDGWLYAVGDANRRALLTHQGKYQGRAAGDVIVARARRQDVHDQPWGRHVATADHAAVPQVTFSRPPVASVGLTSQTAEDRGFRIRVVDYDLGQIAGAITLLDGYQGQARLVIDEDRQIVIGATFVGPRVQELLHSATIAIVGEVPLSRLWHAVPPYPTISEVWLRLLETYGRDISS